MHTIEIEFEDGTYDHTIIGEIAKYEGFNVKTYGTYVDVAITFTNKDGSHCVHRTNGYPTRVSVSTDLQRESIYELGSVVTHNNCLYNPGIQEQPLITDAVQLRDGRWVSRTSIDWKNECLRMTEELNARYKLPTFNEIKQKQTDDNITEYWMW